MMVWLSCSQRCWMFTRCECSKTVCWLKMLTKGSVLQVLCQSFFSSSKSVGLHQHAWLCLYPFCLVVRLIGVARFAPLRTVCGWVAMLLTCVLGATHQWPCRQRLRHEWFHVSSILHLRLPLTPTLHLAALMLRYGCASTNASLLQGLSRNTSSGSGRRPP